MTEKSERPETFPRHSSMTCHWGLEDLKRRQRESPFMDGGKHITVRRKADHRTGESILQDREKHITGRRKHIIERKKAYYRTEESYYRTEERS